ncbi:serine hydrolase [Salmonella enterica]|nr:serine hydrolase [Salmonella enterica]
MATTRSFRNGCIHLSSARNGQIVNGVKHRYVIGSLNDTIVPTELTLKLSQQLNAPFYALPDSGHFLGDDGINELPLVLQLLT